MVHFASPNAFVLLVLPILASRLLPPRSSGGGGMKIPASIASQFGTGSRLGIEATTNRALPFLIWIALVTALAGPRVVLPGQALPPAGHDIVLALDLSGSMETEDFEEDGKPARRLDVVKRVATEFVQGREGDRVGLVIFAETAYFAAPLTYDVNAVADRIDEVTVGIAGRSTAISDGLGLAMKRLQAAPTPTRVVVLLSDGQNTSGNVLPLDAAALAASMDIRVHTIAMGIHDTSDGSGSRDAVDAQMLRGIAEQSGGTAFRVKTTADLEAVGRAIDELEARTEATLPRDVYRDLWVLPGAFAFLMALGLHLRLRKS